MQCTNAAHFLPTSSEDPIRAKSQAATLPPPSLHSALRSSSPLQTPHPKRVSFADEREDDSCSSSSSVPQFRPLHSTVVARYCTCHLAVVSYLPSHMVHTHTLVHIHMYMYGCTLSHCPVLLTGNVTNTHVTCINHCMLVVGICHIEFSISTGCI